MIGDSDNNILEAIKNKIQIIVDKKFSNDRYVKRKIDVYNDRYNFCCPYCNDSKDPRKKRGNLYFNSLHFHCFNCGESVGVNKLLSDFNESLSNEDRIAVHEIQQNSKRFEPRHSSAQSSISMRLLEKLAVPKSVFFKSLDLISPYKNDFVSSYLKSRKIDIRDWKYFAFHPETKELYILNTTDQDRIIGYQIRQLDSDSRKTRYLSRRLTKMYDECFHKDINSIIEKLLLLEPMGQKYIDEEDGIENISANLDRISGIFNIMNINMSSTITIMEGPIDSLGIPNSIALQGASKSLNGFFDNMDNVRFLFDNDKTGKEMSIRKLKEHKQIFLWSSYLKMKNINNKIKDINDLQKKGLLDVNLIERCFSNDEFDAILI